VRPVAVVATAQTPAYAAFPGPEAVLVMRCVNEVLARARIGPRDVDYTVAGSCDYLSGAPFAFVMNLDGMHAWPPIHESHVEMDGAWALADAWHRLQLGDVDVALVVGSGRSSPGDHRSVLALQGDPYVAAPLGLDPASLAGIQARALLDAGLATEADFAAVVARSRRDARANPYARRDHESSPAAAPGPAIHPDPDPGRRPAVPPWPEGDPEGDPEVAALLAEPHWSAPLRRHDLPATADGAAAVVLAAGDRARALTDTPVWVRGIDHRIETHHVGWRDLTDSPSARRAAEAVGLHDGPVDVAELMACYSPQELVLRRALGLDGATTRINPSGGPLAADPVMATGLVRVAEAAGRIAAGEARRALAHASSGPCLQQNLLCVLEGDR
jgi:acetyl-CoA acetyltransferase